MWKLLGIALLASTVLATSERPRNEETHLLRRILEHYPLSATRAVVNMDDPWDVKMGLALLNIINVDTDAQTIEVVIWKLLSWSDPFITWNTTALKVDRFRIDPSILIHPDISAYNAASEPVHLVKAYAIATPGQILYVPAMKQTFTCNMSRADEFTCDLKFGSWTFSEDLLDLNLRSEKVDISFYQPNNKWEVINTKAVRHTRQYPCCVESYVDLTFSITVKQRK